MTRWTQLDRGTDIAAIRVRRLMAVLPLGGGVFVLEPLGWALTIFGVIWLYRRRWTSPPVPDLREAVIAGDLDAAHRLLARGADARAVRWDRSLMDEARAQGDAEMAKLLIAYGAEPPSSAAPASTPPPAS